MRQSALAPAVDIQREPQQALYPNTILYSRFLLMKFRRWNKCDCSYYFDFMFILTKFFNA